MEFIGDPFRFLYMPLPYNISGENIFSMKVPTKPRNLSDLDRDPGILPAVLFFSQAGCLHHNPLRNSYLSRLP
jgi:hypothetical protein